MREKKAQSHWPLNSSKLCTFTFEMDKRPFFILRNMHIRQQSRILNRKNSNAGNAIYSMAINSADLPSLCYKQHVMWSQELDESYKKGKGKLQRPHRINIYGTPQILHDHIPTIPQQAVTNFRPPVDLFPSCNLFSKSPHSCSVYTPASSTIFNSVGSTLLIFNTLQKALWLSFPNIQKFCREIK